MTKAWTAVRRALLFEKESNWQKIVESPLPQLLPFHWTGAWGPDGTPNCAVFLLEVMWPPNRTKDGKSLEESVCNTQSHSVLLGLIWSQLFPIQSPQPPDTKTESLWYRFGGRCKARYRQLIDDILHHAGRNTGILEAKNVPFRKKPKRFHCISDVYLFKGNQQCSSTLKTVCISCVAARVSCLSCYIHTYIQYIPPTHTHWNHISGQLTKQ